MKAPLLVPCLHTLNPKNNIPTIVSAISASCGYKVCMQLTAKTFVAPALTDSRHASQPSIMWTYQLFHVQGAKTNYQLTHRPGN